MTAGGHRLSSEAILRVLEVCGANCSQPAPYILQQADDKPFRLYETLASAWQTEGVELAPEVRARLEAVREREEHCSDVVPALQAVNGLREQKGRQLAALYPAGWLRPSNDIDLRVPDVRRALEVWRILRAHGFEELLFCTATSAPTGVDLIYGLARSGPFEMCRLGDRVEVSTILLPGHHVAAPARQLPAGTEITPLVETGLALLDEQFQRGVRARDVLDAIVLLDVLSGAERQQWQSTARRMGRRIELQRLIALVARTGLRDVEDLMPSSRAAAGLSRASARLGRTQRVAQQAARPVRLLVRYTQARQLKGGGLVADRLERLLQQRMTYTSAWHAGLYFFGVPILDADGADVPAAGTLVLWDAHAVLGTPSGPLALTPWTELPENELRLPHTVADEASPLAVETPGGEE